MDASELLEIIPLIDHVPGKDLILYRGEPLPLVDPHLCSSGTHCSGKCQLQKALVCRWKGQDQKYGILISEAHDVYEIDDSDIQPNSVSSQIVDGIIIQNDEMVILLNIQSLVQRELPPQECEVELF